MVRAARRRRARRGGGEKPLAFLERFHVIRSVAHPFDGPADLTGSDENMSRDRQDFKTIRTASGREIRERLRET